MQAGLTRWKKKTQCVRVLMVVFVVVVIVVAGRIWHRLLLVFSHHSPAMLSGEHGLCLLHSEHINIRINCTPKIGSECLSPLFVWRACSSKNVWNGTAKLSEIVYINKFLFVFLCSSSSGKMQKVYGIIYCSSWYRLESFKALQAHPIQNY